ncbi:uncharacterized protein LOC116878621 [Lontra canadensis]|uniref:uncharacterized protein LOC116878621 n=1 Tax=Lontra canadensis TaxID=76717 RepID=UPI0013F30BA6|nr:uncharacterized protein LOC116878621 [Lontra canadensis]
MQRRVTPERRLSPAHWALRGGRLLVLRRGVPLGASGHFPRASSPDCPRVGGPSADPASSARTRLRPSALPAQARGHYRQCPPGQFPFRAGARPLLLPVSRSCQCRELPRPRRCPGPRRSWVPALSGLGAPGSPRSRASALLGPRALGPRRSSVPALSGLGAPRSPRSRASALLGSRAPNLPSLWFPAAARSAHVEPKGSMRVRWASWLLIGLCQEDICSQR